MIMTQITAEYIQHAGSDLMVVNSARVSFGKRSEMEDDPWGPPKLKEDDARLIRYLAKHNHISPFNHTWVTFQCRAPMFVARQLQKHEYMPWNEISRRYTTENIEFYTPEVWRGKSADKKQGSDGVVDVGDWGDANWACLTAYNDLLDMGVAPEQARMVLPQSMYTEWFWSGTVGAIAKMCNLRCKPDTQAETRIVADQISEKMKELFPVSWEALTNA
jgi:thymidylate synthase (FAD)